jgi:SAM-dependent methyltransferase
MQSWLTYWNAPNTSYVSERHKQAHYDVLFSGIRPYLPASQGVVLDWGCGDAYAAGRIAAQCGVVLLFDAAETTRQRLQLRYGATDRIRVLDQSALDAMPAGSVDLVIVNSVVQYLSAEAFSESLNLFQRLIRPGGALLLGDVISPGTGNLRHATTFLRFAWERGFLLAAMGGLAHTFVSPYRKLQHDLGLTTYTPFDMLQTLERHGFLAEKLPRNIAVSLHRSSYIAHKPGSSAAPRPGDHEAALPMRGAS